MLFKKSILIKQYSSIFEADSTWWNSIVIYKFNGANLKVE